MPEVKQEKKKRMLILASISFPTPLPCFFRLQTVQILKYSIASQVTLDLAINTLITVKIKVNKPKKI